MKSQLPRCLPQKILKQQVQYEFLLSWRRNQAEEASLIEESVEEEVEEPAASQTEMTPVFGEDIWSRERSLAGERTAEELFESESSQDIGSSS